MVRLLFSLLILSAAISRIGSAQDNQARDTTSLRHPEVRELRITGVKKFKVSDVRAALATQPSRCRSLVFKPACVFTKSPTVFEHNRLDQDEFKRDVIRLLVFYFRRGYRDARVDTTVKRDHNNRVHITLAVTEGPPTTTTAVVVRGIDSTLTRSDTVREIKPRPGEPFSLIKLDSTVAHLSQRLSERGYADATITLKATTNDSTRQGSADILIDHKKLATIGGVRVRGNSKINEQTILNSLTFKTGDVFRTSQIAYSQRALYESALFRRAVIDTMPRDSSRSLPDSVKMLVVRVREAPLREARTSFGFTTADFIQAEGAFTHNYLADRPLRLDMGLTVGNLLAKQLTSTEFFADISNIVRDNDLGRYYTPTYQANLDLRQRWFGSPRNTIGAGLFMHRRSAPGVLIDRGYGAHATFTRELSMRLPLSVRYQFEVTKVDAGDVYFCVNYGVCDNPTINALRGRQRLSPLSLTLSIDRTDAPFSPTRGVVARAEFEHASQFTASDFRYNRAYFDAAAYRRIGGTSTVLAAHVRAGWVVPLAGTSRAVNGNSLNENDQILHPRKRFYAGGSQSVRGFGENQLGPRVLTVSSAALKRGAVVGKDTIPCAPTAPSAECLTELKDDDFQTRPLGGTTLLEGNIELRIPVYGSFVLAVFVDGAVLGNGGVTTITRGSGAVTPGFGFRYQSPVGPIRVDLGIRPKLERTLPVITEVRDSTGTLKLVDLTNGAGCGGPMPVGCRTYPSSLQKPSFLTRVTNRLTLHLSIGEAF